MAPPQYKDFSKDASDLLKKNYSAIGEWKLESKFKGPDSVVFINPQLEKDQFKVDVEYNVKAYGLKSKATISKPSTIEPTVTYEAAGHKVEGSYKKKELEVVYEFKSELFSIYDKLTRKDLTAAASWQCCKEASLGASTTFDMEGKSLNSWAVGFQYNQSGRQVSITTDKLQKFSTAVLFPVPISQIPKLKVAVTADCARGGSAKIAAGCELLCPLGTGTTFRIKADNKFLVTLAAIRSFADGWKAALTVDSTLKGFGLYVVRE